MKKIVITLCMLSALWLVSMGQCGFNYEETLQQHCKGTYLVHFELNNPSATKVHLVLKSSIRYAVYFLNAEAPFSVEISKGEPHSPVSGTERWEDESRNLMVYRLTPPETAVYHFTVDFDTPGDACVLMAVYVEGDTLYKPGIYKSLDELIHNKPSVPHGFKMITKSRRYAFGEMISYRLDMDKNTGKSLGRMVGFSDGVNVYINEKNPKAGPGTEFVQLEKYGRYGYYEVLDYTPIVTGSIVMLSYNRVQKLLDFETGETDILNRKTLRQIMAGDPELLARFENESRKDRKLKQYLVEYTQRNNRH